MAGSTRLAIVALLVAVSYVGQLHAQVYNPYVGGYPVSREGYYNAYTGTRAAEGTVYNPYTGGYRTREAAVNPSTGTEATDKSYHNPYTGASANVQKAYNPYTGKTAYHYNYRR